MVANLDSLIKVCLPMIGLKCVWMGVAWLVKGVIYWAPPTHSLSEHCTGHVASEHSQVLVAMYTDAQQ